MGTTVKPELSPKSKHWIEKHRFYELKHFCLQYPTWKKVLSSLDGINGKSNKYIFIRNHIIADPTEKCAELRTYYSNRMDMVKNVAIDTDPVIGPYIFKAVTDGLSYNILKLRLNIPCCKDTYYDLYRRFFWLLDRVRK